MRKHSTESSICNALAAPKREKLILFQEERAGAVKRQHLNQASKILDQGEKIEQIFAKAG